MNDVTSLKNDTHSEEKHAMAQLKKSFDTATVNATLRAPAVLERTLQLFEGDIALAEKWLSEPNRALGWKSPVEMLSHPSGIDKVLMLITRIEHGVYS